MMKQFSAIPLLAALALTASCGNNGQKTAESQKIANDNPFLKASTLDFQAPDFTKIKSTDFQPAMEEGMRQQLEEVNKIADNPDSATFENTLVALEKSGRMLARVEGVFFMMTGANTNDTLQKVEEAEAPKLAAHQDAIFLNNKLFQRVSSIYDKRDQLNLDPESKRLVEYYYEAFVKAGAKLSDENKTELKKLNEEEASLSAKFSNQLLAAAKEGALVLDNKADLDGLSDGEIAAAQQDAESSKLKNKWQISLQNTTQQPDLTNLTNRSVREKLFMNSWNRAEKGDANDTRKTISRIAEIRAQKAKLLGFDNFAAWQLQDQMAKTPQAVQDFLGKLVPAATAKAKAEGAELQKMIDQGNEKITLEAWDWNYYSEKLRKAKYDLNEDAIKPYFVLDSVLKNGVFFAANQLYGLTFKERKDLPVWQKDVRVFEVHDKDGSTIGLFYSDYFKRDNKSGGAWMDNMVQQSKLLGTNPVIYNVCNFTKPAPGQPALLTWDDVTTMFHEFGHALHGFFASQEYPSLSGTAVARDFVEFPSQFNEHWAMNPIVFKNYAKNYKTGEPMPQELIDKIKKSATFNQGYALTEVLAAASLDMQWHIISADKKIDNVDTFENQALERTHLLLRTVPTRYRSTYFLHIWGNGYAAGYYAYLWTEMLDDDAFSWFEQHGGMSRENGQRFRDMILSRGNTEDLGKMFHDFVGHDPNIQPMLEDRGLVEKK